MNEPRIIFRHCAVYGKDIEVKLSGKDHWWHKRKILEGGYFFSANINLHRVRSRWSWHYSLLMTDTKSKSRIHQFLSDHIWWWTIPEEECNVPNWKKPYYMIRQWIEETLDPPEAVEYWECPECFEKEDEEEEKDSMEV